MNKDEFDSLVHRNQGLIWKVCKTFATNKEDQKDLFQDILLKLWKGRESYSGNAKVSTWIYRVSLNQAIDQSRKKRMDSSYGKNPDHLPSPTDTSGYDIEALYLAINRLSPVNRAIIVLYLDQLSYQEIAEIMGLSEKNVSVKLVRIKEKLKEIYLQLSQTLQP